MYAANILYDNNNYSNILCIISNYLNSHYNLIFSKKHKIYKVDNILRFNSNLRINNKFIIIYKENISNEEQKKEI